MALFIMGLSMLSLYVSTFGAYLGYSEEILNRQEVREKVGEVGEGCSHLLAIIGLSWGPVPLFMFLFAAFPPLNPLLPATLSVSAILMGAYTAYHRVLHLQRATTGPSRFVVGESAWQLGLLQVVAGVAVLLLAFFLLHGFRLDL